MAYSRRRGTYSSVGVAALVCVIAAGSARSALAGEVQRSRLDNGLEVVLCPSEDGDKVALLVLYSIGEDHDPVNKCGLSHLLEHVYMTAAAGQVPARTVQQVMQEFPQAWNAQTGSDYTVFSTVFSIGQLESEIREAAWRMGDLKPELADLDRERPRLLEELGNMYGGFPPLASLNYARSKVRPSAVGHRKGGLDEHVEKFTLDDVRNWWKKYYKPANAMVVLTGPFDPGAAKKLVTEHFGSIAAGDRPPAAHREAKPKLGQLEIVSIQPAMPNSASHATIAFPLPPPNDEQYSASLVVGHRLMMRTGRSGGEYQLMFSLLDDPSLIAVSSAVKDQETPEQAVGRIRAVVEEAVSEPLKPADKLQVKASLGIFLGLMEVPPMLFRVNPYGAGFSLGRRQQLRVDSGELGRRLETLTQEQFHKQSAAVFSVERQASVVVTPEVDG